MAEIKVAQMKLHLKEDASLDDIVCAFNVLNLTINFVPCIGLGCKCIHDYLEVSPTEHTGIYSKRAYDSVVRKGPPWQNGSSFSTESNSY